MSIIPNFLRILFGGLTLLASASGAERRIVAYAPNWIDLPAFAGSIDYTKLTHINIAFENPINDDGDLSFHKHNAAIIERAHAAGVKVLVSIGGGAAASDAVLKPRYFRLISDAKREAFVGKLTAYVKDHGFDGLDVDLEGPSINADYGAFIRDLSATLKPHGLLLTAALSKGYGGKNVPADSLALFDFVNIMAYDATGPWQPNTPGQHSSLAFAKDNVAYWLGRGLPKDKAVLGVPFYGHGFGASAQKGGWAFSKIIEAFPGAEQRDEAGETIFYNGIPTIRTKARYVADESLGGVMIWSLDQDAKGEHSLLRAIHEGLSVK